MSGVTQNLQRTIAGHAVRENKANAKGDVRHEGQCSIVPGIDEHTLHMK